MNSEMDFLLYGGVVVTGLIVGFGYKMITKCGQAKLKNDAMKKITDFYATQDQEHNY